MLIDEDVIARLRWLEVQAIELRCRAAILRKTAQWGITTRRPILTSQDKQWFFDLYHHFYWQPAPVQDPIDPLSLKRELTQTRQLAQEARAQSQQLKLASSKTRLTAKDVRQKHNQVHAKINRKRSPAS